jgi:hypothetical protein
MRGGIKRAVCVLLIEHTTPEKQTSRFLKCGEIVIAQQFGLNALCTVDELEPKSRFASSKCQFVNRTYGLTILYNRNVASGPH